MDFSETITINALFAEIILWIGITLNFIVLDYIYKKNELIRDFIFRAESTILWISVAILTHKWAFLIFAAIWLAVSISSIRKIKTAVECLTDFNIAAHINSCKKELSKDKKCIKDITLNLEKETDKEQIKNMKYNLERIKRKVIYNKFLLSTLEYTDDTKSLSTKEALSIVFNPTYFN